MAVAPARRIASGLVLLCAGFAPVASAQRASLMAHASVTDVRVTARATRQLQFGALPRGVTVTIDSRSSSRGVSSRTASCRARISWGLAGTRSHLANVRSPQGVRVVHRSSNKEPLPKRSRSLA